MAFSLVGTHTFTPNDTKVLIGSVSMNEGDDTIWVRITQNQPTGAWPWSYGILGWQSSFGYELGTTKAFAEPQGAVQRLGVRRREIKAYRRWIRTQRLQARLRSTYAPSWHPDAHPWDQEAR